MATKQPKKRRMVYDPVANVWRSATLPKDPTRARVLTPEQYAAKCEQGRIAAAAEKVKKAYLASEEWQQEMADMEARQRANANKPMRPLPGTSDWYHAQHVAVNRFAKVFK